MENNNNPGQPIPSGGDQNGQPPQMPYGQPPMQGQMPQQPMPGAYPPQGQQAPYGYPQQPVVPKQPMNPATKKKIILFSCIGGAVLVLGILALIFIPMILKVNYETAYEKARAANEAARNMNSYDSCWGVRSNVNSSGVTKADFSRYVSKCLESISTFKSRIEELAREGAVSRDVDIKKEWDVFKPVFDRTMPVLEQIPGVHKSWHEYIVNFSEFERANNQDTWNDSRIDEIFKPLIDSGNKTLSDFGKGYSDIIKRYVSELRRWRTASDTVNNMSWNDPGIRAARDARDAANSAQRAARTEANNYAREHTPNFSNTKDLFDADLSTEEYDIDHKWGGVFNVISRRFHEQATREAIERLLR
jgi:hypothetical protein